MSIQAVRKTGFLIEDGRLWGQVIGYLKFYCGGEPEAVAMAAVLDTLRAQTYYEPMQPKLIVDEIEEVTA